MSGVVQVSRVAYMPEVWFVPVTLADFECRHGELDGCEQCELEQPQQAIEQPLVETGP